MRADLAFKAQLLPIGGQQQFDRRRVEPDAMVQALDPVRQVNALDGQHRGQDLRFGDGCRIARKQRFDIERAPRLDHEMHAVAGNVHARNLVDDTVDLRDHDAVLEGRRFDDGRRVLGIRARIQIAVRVGAHRGNQRDARRQVDEIPGEQFEIRMHGAERDLAAEQHLRNALRLRTGISEIEPRGDPAFEDVEVFRQHDAGLDHMQAVHPFRRDGGERGSQHIGLLLVVAFEADPVPRPQHRFQQRYRVARVYGFMPRVACAGRQPCIAIATRATPFRHKFLPRNLMLMRRRAPSS